MSGSINLKRRSLLIGAAVLPLSQVVRAVPSTPSAMEGPFYPTQAMRFSDEDNDLVKVEGAVQQAGGEIVTISGTLHDDQGSVLAGSTIEIWQCDVNGRYLHTGDRSLTPRDSGFQGFGKAITDAEGRFWFRTIKPVPYPGRTPHIHLKVWQDDWELLTTQLYIADHPGNQRDRLFQRMTDEQKARVSLKFDSQATPNAKVDLVVA